MFRAEQAQAETQTQTTCTLIVQVVQLIVHLESCTPGRDRIASGQIGTYRDWYVPVRTAGGTTRYKPYSKAVRESHGRTYRGCGVAGGQASRDDHSRARHAGACTLGHVCCSLPPVTLDQQFAASCRTTPPVERTGPPGGGRPSATPFKLLPPVPCCFEPSRRRPKHKHKQHVHSFYKLYS
jgi:hypothetical protein